MKPDAPFELEPTDPPTIPIRPSQLSLVEPANLNDLAFDEMNLVEIPFCLLTKSRSRKNRKILLSRSGNDFLEATGETYGLPTALAERVVLALMWLTKQQNELTHRVVRFPIRRFVEQYMYPHRKNAHRISGRTVKNVEEELHRIAATRVRSKKWFDRRKNKFVEIDASIIDYITVEDPGGKNRARIVEVAWGTKAFQSMQSQYTKGLDAETYLKIPNPLGARIYRWLDRQFGYPKPIRSIIHVPSCQEWARFTLMMTGGTLERGGRVASNYILRKVSAELKALEPLNFAVQLEVDQARPDFAFRFTRIRAAKNEVVDADLAGDLVRRFQEVFHGVRPDSHKYRLKEADREFAQVWLDAYGFDVAYGLIAACRVLHLEGPQRERPMGFFKGLAFYEDAALQRLEKTEQERAGQLSLELQAERAAQWGRYKLNLREKTAEDLGLEGLDALRDQARAALGPFVERLSPAVREQTVNAELTQLLLQQARAMTVEEFQAQADDAALEAAVIARHGFNALAT